MNPLPSPSADTIAAIAATLVGNGTNIDAAPASALRLWQQSQYLIEREDWKAQYYREREEELVPFLEACDLTRDDLPLRTGLPKVVALEVFLKALAPQSKIKTMEAKWEEFWKLESAQPARADTGFDNAYADFQLPENATDGICSTSIAMCREYFSKFLESKSDKSGIKSGQAGPRAKKVYAVVRAVLAGGELTPMREEILKSMTQEERKRAIEKFDMDVGQIRRLDAAVKTCNMPTRGRSRSK